MTAGKFSMSPGLLEVIEHWEELKVASAPPRGLLQVTERRGSSTQPSVTACELGSMAADLVQVIEHREELKVAAETMGVNGTAGTGRQGSRPPSPLLEAVLSLELSHPNIIKTYKYETRTVQVGFEQALPSCPQKPKMNPSG